MIPRQSPASNHKQENANQSEPSISSANRSANHERQAMASENSNYLIGVLNGSPMVQRRIKRRKKQVKLKKELYIDYQDMSQADK